MIKCQIPKGCLVYAPNLVSLCCSRPVGYVPWIENLGSPGIVNIILRQTPVGYPEYTDPVSCNLKVLKLSHVHLDDTTLSQLCSRCTSLEELELEVCSVDGKQIGSTSLKYLAMISCKFAIGFRVHAPNLVLLRCIKPFQYYPQIHEMEFLVTAAIVLDDSCFLSDCQWPQEDESDNNTNNESHGDSGDSKHNDSDDNSIYYDSDRSAPSDEEDDDCPLSYSVIAEDRFKESKYLIYGHRRSADEPVKSWSGEYESMVSSNSGGVGMLRSLSHVKTMDLLAHPREAYNSRLGCIAIKSSFVCTKLKMVRITCCKRDVMVHRLAYFFSENKIPHEMIFVCRTACSGCQGGHRLQGKGKAQSAAEMREEKKMKAGV